MSESLGICQLWRSGYVQVRPLYYMLQRPHCYTSGRGFVKLTEMLLPGSPWASTYLGQRDLDEALHHAAYEGKIEVVRLILARGACVNSRSRLFGSALLAAVEGGHVEIAELLLKQGANVNAQYRNIELTRRNSGSALEVAARSGNLMLVKLLLKYGANINPSPNASILASADKSLVPFLLNNGANINGRNSEGVGVLYKAARRSEIYDGEVTFRFLLERGADVNAEGGHYGNALQALCRYTRVKQNLVKLLLDKGANINAKGGFYGNALQAACFSHEGDLRGSVVELLLDRGADINAQGGHYGTALQAACDTKWLNPIYPAYHVQWLKTKPKTKPKTKLVAYLLEKGADARIQGGKYGSALQAACGRGHIDVVHLLLGRGADVNVQGGKYGNTLQAACSSHNIKTVRLLLDRGADVNAQGGKHGNALQAAAVLKLNGLFYREEEKTLELVNSYSACCQVNDRAEIRKCIAKAACAGVHD
ncbi:hypothetical protein RRF57_008879 [Xylaria bambusicola]|uniref:Uncharacterized protein n=1 Tax=Xylaria bambusicola TaxID=326684 RepID=A0AAN7UIN0_9PEZI